MKCYFWFIMLIGFGSMAQTVKVENDSLLIWNENRKLTWDDFLSEENTQADRYKNNTESVTGAVLVPSISIFPKEFNCQEVEDIVIVPIVNKKKSCVIIKRDEILSHEQTHFDIAELYARKMRKKLDSILAENEVCDLQAIADMYYKLENEFWEAQFLYDDEVRINGKEDVNQKIWDRKIDSLLNVYEEYKRNISIEDLDLK